MNELFRLGPRCFPNRLNEEINEHARDDERRNPARRPVGDFDVRDPMGEHNRKKNQNQNATHINEQLYRRHKIGAEKYIKPGCTRERPEKRKRGIDDVARKRYHKRRTHRDQGDQIKNCRREIHSSFNFGVLESQRLFGSNTGRPVWDQEVLRIITGLAPLFCCLSLLGGCPSVRRGEFIQILQPDVDFLCQLGIRFTALLGLIERLRLSYKMTDQARRIVTCPFEFLRVADSPGWTSLRTESTIHAFANINIEMSEIPLLRRFVHFDADGDAGNRAIPLTGQAPGADIHIDFENPPVAPRQSFLDRHRNLIRVLNGHWTANQVRKSNGHSLENRGYRVLDIFNVTRNAHKYSNQN